jgi:ectoine hydroxylase-related dioxygenase (phytanoyl-CoA dioxygenase family)
MGPLMPQSPVMISLTGCGTVQGQRRISAVSRQAGLLTAGQRESLERDGYLLVSSLLEETVLAPMRARLDELVHQTLQAWDASPGKDVEERGVVNAALGLSDPDFAPCREHPLLAEAGAAMIGRDWHLAGLELRAPLPGCGHQGLHPDYFPGQRTHGPWRSVSAMWCISAFTPENGPLRVIPGSHRVARSPVDDLKYGSEMGPHPAEVRLIAPAGSLILFNNADLWHSGTFNYSPAPRLAVTAALRCGRTSADPAARSPTV